MGAIAFQKLNGEGTAAQAQLDKLTQINGNLLDIKSKLNMPDLKAWFHLLFPDLPYIPYYSTYNFDGDALVAFMPVPLGKRVFAKVSMECRQMGVADSDNATNGVQFNATLGANSVYSIINGYHGDDILNIRSTNGEFIGVIDGFATQTFFDVGICHCSAVVMGFVIPDDYDINQLSDLPAVPVDNTDGGGVILMPIINVPRIGLAEMPDGINYLNTDLAGMGNFEIYYMAGSTFLTPGIDFEYKPEGGFTMTGFGAIVFPMEFKIIF